MKTTAKIITRRSLRLGTGTRTSRRCGQKTNDRSNVPSSLASKVILKQKITGLKQKGVVVH